MASVLISCEISNNILTKRARNYKSISGKLYRRCEQIIPADPEMQQKQFLQLIIEIKWVHLSRFKLKIL